MTLVQQVYAQAMLLSDVEEAAQIQLLHLYCRSAVSNLTAQLRPGLTPNDCKADFVAAAALYALAALTESDRLGRFSHVQLGDVTMKPATSSAACQCLRSQAQLIMAPYLKDRFSFRGV